MSALAAATPLPWQMPIWQQFLTLQRNERLPHALLLSGPKGSGKQRFAEALLARLLCTATGEVACGECHGCQMLAAGYIVGFVVYQIGTLIVSGTVGTAFVPGLIAVAAMVAIVVWLIVRAERKLKAELSI